jgi:hypothetical protein
MFPRITNRICGMTAPPRIEAKIDVSNAHYQEQRHWKWLCRAPHPAPSVQPSNAWWRCVTTWKASARGFDGQTPEDGAPAAEVLAAVDDLLAAIDASDRKLPARKATLTVLEELRIILHWADQQQARDYFDVGI